MSRERCRTDKGVKGKREIIQEEELVRRNEERDIRGGGESKRGELWEKGKVGEVDDTAYYTFYIRYCFYFLSFNLNSF